MVFRVHGIVFQGVNFFDDWTVDVKLIYMNLQLSLLQHFVTSVEERKRALGLPTPWQIFKYLIPGSTHICLRDLDQENWMHSVRSAAPPP